MKRQHPENPDLFWCRGCESYKEREGFGKHKGRNFGIRGECRECESDRRKKHPRKKTEARREASRKYCAANPEKMRALAKKWYHANHEKTRKAARIKEFRQRTLLLTTYIRAKCRRQGIEITPETIELKRQQLIMKRTLKQFKKWRQENESNHADVHGKQFENEADNERRIQAG